MHAIELPLLLHSCIGATAAELQCCAAIGLLQPASHSAASIEGALKRIIRSDFVGALLEPICAAILGQSQADGQASLPSSSIATEVAVSAFFEALRARIREAVSAAVHSGGDDPLAAIVCTGVAALHVFNQHNLTGPTEPLPPNLLQLHEVTKERVADPAIPATIGDDRPSADEAWITAALQVDGEDVAGRVSQLQYLLLAEVLLVEPLQLVAAGHALESSSQAGLQLQQRFPSWAWWALRTVVAHQHVLAGRAATLLRHVSELARRLLVWAGDVQAQPRAEQAGQDGGQPLSAAGVENKVLAVLYMELGQAQHQYGYVDAAKLLLEQAGQLLGLDVSLSGAMGRRTIHQADAKAQLTVLVSRRPVATLSPSTGDADTDVDVGLLQPGLRAALGSGAGGGGEGSRSQAAAAAAPAERDLEGLTAESEVYLSPQLDESGAAPRYSGVEQALMLAWGTHVRKGSAHDELQEWQVAAYAEAVLAQPRSQYMLQATAVLHKVRHERNRPRTRERSLLSMELLCEALRGPPLAATPPGTATVVDGGDIRDSVSLRQLSRAPLAFAVWFPLQLALRKELAEHYVSMGFVGAALKQYEALHLWDAIIVCYRMLDKRAAADNLIRARLKVTPDDPKLWCALGDLHLDDSHYYTAWQRSGQRHARSQRSLGHSAMRRKDYISAAGHYELALALNPLNAQAWFALGYCRMKEEDIRGALKAFSQVTQQEPDNGEAWNNCAALWLQLGHADRAFSAQAEALRSKRDSWQAWENYAQAALGSGNLMQCTRGLKQVLDLSAGQRLKADILSGLLDQIDPEQQQLQQQQGANPPVHAPAADATASKAPAPVGGAPSAVPSPAQANDDEDDLASLVFDLHLPLSIVPSVVADGSANESRAEWMMGQVEAEAPCTSGRPTAAAAVPSHDRQHEQLLAAIGSLLRDAVNAPACSPALWGCLGRYYGLGGELESQKEALLKQVRALQTSSAFKVEEHKFVEMAQAVTGLTHAYLQIHERVTASAATAAATCPGGAAAAAATTPASTGARELSAARLQLRGLVKATEARFESHPEWARLAKLLREVEAREAAARA